MAGETFKSCLVTQQATITPMGAWIAYTPQLLASPTNPNLGSGTGWRQNGRYILLGRMVFAEFSVAFGSTGFNIGAGGYNISLPITSKNASTEDGCGHGWLYDSSAARLVLCYFRMYQTTDRTTIYFTGTGTFSVNQVTPWVWDQSDYIQGVLMYEAA
jgi:hypothetical protein